jgi:major vault protein
MKWFNVENYVKFLTEHTRSMLRNVIKRMGVEEFYGNSINIIRDNILGLPGDEGKRPGRYFDENGMRVYDVEVLGVVIGDNTIADLFVKAQHNTVQQAIRLAQEQKELDVTQKSEEIKQKIAEARSDTLQKQMLLQIDELEKSLKLTLSKIGAEIEAEELRLSRKLAHQKMLTDVEKAELSRDKERREQELLLAKQALEQRIEELNAHVRAVVDKAQAVSPDLIAALQAFADKNLAEKMAETMAPLAILGGKSIAEVFATLLKDTPLENVMKKKAQ